MDHLPQLTLNQKKKIAVDFLNRFTGLLNSRTKFSTLWKLLVEDYHYLSTPFNKFNTLSSRKEKLLQELAKLEQQLAPSSRILPAATQVRPVSGLNPNAATFTPKAASKNVKKHKPKPIPEIGADPVLQHGQLVTKIPPPVEPPPVKETGVDAQVSSETRGSGLLYSHVLTPGTPQAKGARSWSQMVKGSDKTVVPTPGSLAPPRKKGKEEPTALPQQVKPPRAQPFQHPITQLGTPPSSVGMKQQAGTRVRNPSGLAENSQGATKYQQQISSSTTSGEEDTLNEFRRQRQHQKKMDALTKKSFHATGLDYLDNKHQRKYS